MVKTTVKVEGMTCRMCEARIRNALRRELPALRIRAHARRGEVTVISRDTLSEEGIRTTLAAIGYRVSAVTVMPFAPRGLFALLYRK